MRFLLAVWGIWGFSAALVFTEHIPLWVGLICAIRMTQLLWRHGKENPFILKIVNRWKRWRWFYLQLSSVAANQREFCESDEHKGAYAAAGKGVSDEQIQAWISDEVQKETSRYNITASVRFFTTDKDIEERADQLADFIAKSARFFFIKLAWWPKWFRSGFIKGLRQASLKNVLNHYGEALPHELSVGCFGESGDSCAFFLKKIKERWGYIDFNRTCSPEDVARKIAQHEIRHCAQYQSLRKAGGGELVERVVRRARKARHGTTDMLEYDAYRCQLGEERSIDEFLREALIEIE